MSFKIISWNVNGIRAVHKKGLFVPFVAKHQPDIFCLQETKANATSLGELYSKTCRICQSSQSFPKNLLAVAKAKPPKFFAPRQEILSNLQRLKSNSPKLVACDHQSEVDLPGYQEYWNSATRKGYSGVAIFVRSTGSGQAKDLPASEAGKPLAVLNNLPEKIARKYDIKDDGYGNPNEEGRVLALEFKNFYVVSVYTPNSKDDLSRIPLRQKKWDPAFLEYMKTLEKKKPVIFCGDLNVAHTENDLAKPKENMKNKGFTLQEREGVNNMVEAGFIDSFRLFTQGNGHYTWWSHFANARARNVGWRIDYIFTSDSLKKKIKKAEILPEVMGSDHCPVVVEVSI